MRFHGFDLLQCFGTVSGCRDLITLQGQELVHLTSCREETTRFYTLRLCRASPTWRPACIHPRHPASSETDVVPHSLRPPTLTRHPLRQAHHSSSLLALSRQGGWPHLLYGLPMSEVPHLSGTGQTDSFVRHGCTSHHGQGLQPNSGQQLGVACGTFHILQADREAASCSGMDNSSSVSNRWRSSARHSGRSSKSRMRSRNSSTVKGIHTAPRTSSWWCRAPEPTA